MHHNVNLGVGSGTPDVARHDLDVVHNAWRVWRVWRVQLHAYTIRDPGVTIHITHTVADNCPPRGTMIRLTVVRLILPKRKRQSLFFLSGSVGVLLNDAYRLCLTEPFS